MASSEKRNVGTGLNGVGKTALNLNASVTLAESGLAVDYILENLNSPCFLESKFLANGDNTITVPATAGAVLIAPLKVATYTAILKSIAGATDAEGFTLSKVDLNLISFPPTPPASFVLKWNGPSKNGVAVVLANAGNTLTLAAHGLVAGDAFKFDGSTSLPSELEAGTWYYVAGTVNVNDFQIAAAPGGSVIDFTTDGSGVKITTADEFRLLWI